MNGELAVVTIGPWSGGERELVAQARDGQSEAREELAGRCRRAAYLFALQLMGNRDDAMDVAQEAVMRFLSTLSRFDPERPVRPWLLTIVRNQVRDHWRRQRVRRADSLDDEEHDLSRELADSGDGPERAAVLAELRRRVWRALSELPGPLREILVLRDYHDLTYAEIAKVLKVPAGTVMSRLHRARGALRDVLGPERRELLATVARGGDDR